MERRKDASAGEYDARSGLTHVTRQRGRLLFNMGASGRKQPKRRAEGSESAGGEGSKAADGSKSAGCEDSKAAGGSESAGGEPPAEPRAGRFTGLSLFPEEALYLASRGALEVREAGSGRPLGAAELPARLLERPRISPACLAVYAFLKGEQLHPRRCVDPSAEGEQRREPSDVGADRSPRVAFDVWKSVAAEQQPAVQAGDGGGDGYQRPRKRSKSLQLAFRVLVASFEAPAPSAHALSRALATSEAERPGVGVKLAVVARDRSVLLLDLADGRVVQ